MEQIPKKENMKQNTQTQNNSNSSTPIVAKYYARFYPEKLHDDKLGMDLIMFVHDEDNISRELGGLVPTFTFSNLDEVYNMIKENNFKGYGTDYVEIHNNNNIITIKHPTDSWRDEIHIPIENFTMMIEQWNKLRNDKASEIFFIQKEDGEFIVQTNLEGIILPKEKKEKTCDEGNPGYVATIDMRTNFSFIKNHDNLIQFLLFTFDSVKQTFTMEIGTNASDNSNNEDLIVLSLFFSSANRWEAYQFLKRTDLKNYYEDNTIKIYKFKNTVILEAQEKYNIKANCILGTENFIELINQWETLIRKDVPKIYIVQKGSGPFAMYEHFEIKNEQSIWNKIKSFFKKK